MESALAIGLILPVTVTAQTVDLAVDTTGPSARWMSASSA